MRSINRTASLEPTTNADQQQPAEPAAPTSASAAHRLARGLGRIAPATRMLRFGSLTGLYLWLVVIIIFSVAIPDTFLTSTTAKGIAGDQALTAIIAVGLLAALSAGSFDLSVGQNVGLSAVICSALDVHGTNAALSVAMTLGVGALIGAVNAVLTVVVGVDSFIVTLGMSSALLAVTQIVSGDQFVGPVSHSLQSFADWQLFGLSGYIYYAVIVALLAWIALEHTAAGRRTAATGANTEAARLAGVATSRHRFVTLVACGVAASFAGALLAAKIGAVSPTVGPNYLLPAFAACFLSATQIKPGQFNVWGTVLALLLLGTGIAGLQLLGGQLWISNMFTGLALVLAVSLSVIGERLRARRGERAV